MARILVADDEPGLRAFVAEVLAADGHQVSQCADGTEAVECVGRERFDLLITDLKMPKLDGLTLLRQMRAARLETPVIVMTAHGSVDSAVEAMKLGASDYLEKPVKDPAALRTLVSRVLGQRVARVRGPSRSMAGAFQEFAAALAERYAFERELGQGGGAVVYLAQDLRYRRKVAVKILRPEMAMYVGVERFLREVAIVARLTHPHILPLMESGEAADMLYYVMPYADGGSLRQWLGRQPPPAMSAILRVVSQVGAALDYSHRQGFIHRDVKPENILFTDGWPVVADFGIARAITLAAGEALTEVGVTVGTPEYMSPEQVAGDRLLDGRSDEYSLAVVLFEMLTGEPPFTGVSARAVMGQHLNEPPPLLRTRRSDASAELEEALARALAKDPADRFPSVAEFVAALDGRGPGRSGRIRAIPPRGCRVMDRPMARILVADDEPGLRAFVAEALEADGHTVQQASDGAEAAERLARESFNLLITDLKMPKLDGMSLLRRARADQPEMEVIVLTAHGSVDSAVDAMKLGAFDYLEKPIGSPGELRLLVSRALERRSLLAAKDRSRREEPSLPPLGYGDPAMVPVVDALRKVAATNATVLLTGESGVGKEVAARTLHAWSSRMEGPFVALNCAAVADTLLESELFGHEKGAFTGATATRRGRIELADGGTFFLDEIAEMKPELQAKLLRVLEERRFERVGGTRTIEVDVRWVAATNRPLDELRASGGFREDLYHRVAVFPIHLPPLRERPKDILPLAEVLLRKIGGDIGRGHLVLTDEAERRLLESRWPGNVRELANALERAAILAGGDRIGPEHLVPGTSSASRSRGSNRTLAEIEREAIERALAAAGGNRRAAAEQLGIGLRTLYEKLKRYQGGVEPK